MITTVTLNPCIDRTLTVENMKTGGTNRVISVRDDIGGKGINVAIALKHLGISDKCIGINYSENWKNVEHFLSKQKVAYKFTLCSGSMRVNTKVFDAAEETMTEFNEKGNPVGLDTLQCFMETFDDALNSSELFVFSGSVPPGIPADIYKRMIEKAARFSVPTVLDTSGELLREGIKASPFILKPNLNELSEAAGRELASRQDIIDAAEGLVSSGISYVCVSLGENGAILAGKDGTYEAEPMEIEIRGIQGAGDSMVAGICMALIEKKGPEDMLRYGTAAAAATMLLDGTQMCSREDFDRLLSECRVKKIR